MSKILLPTTEEKAPRRNQRSSAGKSVLIAVFPRSFALEVPETNQIVGREWLYGEVKVDNRVSRNHLFFTRHSGTLFVTDVGSTHGTLINGHRLDKGVATPLPDGGILRMGETILVYRDDFEGPLEPREPMGMLSAPWTLRRIRKELANLAVEVKENDQRLGETNILIEGATGSGKELLARHIAETLGRGGKRYSCINLAAISQNVFEAHLFGWQEGVFTGAGKTNTGLLGAAHGGAVFLDELEALPLELQPKLLRYLQNREVSGVGTKTPTFPNTVVIAASNESLLDKVTSKGFRADILGRFLHRFKLLSLAERPEDIWAIFEAIWKHRRSPLELGALNPEAEAVELMLLHEWPFNVRELERLALAVEPTEGLTLDLLQKQWKIAANKLQKGSRTLTRETVEHALRVCGSEAKAAEYLDVDRAKLRRWREKNSV